MNNVRVAMCQINPINGDFVGNYQKARDAIVSQDADIYIFPECVVTNYTVADMFLNDAFISVTADWVDQWAGLSLKTGKTLIFGAPYGGRENSNRTYNMLLIAQDGKIVFKRGKAARPNYDVFDDKRYFEQYDKPLEVFEWSGNAGARLEKPFVISPAICEEIWQKVPLPKGDVVLTINSSPYAIGKAKRRRLTVLEHVRETGMPIVYVNQVGASDELVFDGGSCAADPNGTFYEMAPFEEGTAVVEFALDASGRYTLMSERAPEEEHLDAEKYIAACLGLQDYFNKVGIWKGIVLGLSGGADSALVALMAADAIGADRVHCVAMPSQFTSDDSNSLAARLASGIGSGIKLSQLPVASIFDVYRANLEKSFPDLGFDLADENLQAQIRGDYLSYLSNKFGYMITSTGNKSEIAMGYATLYGDMRGAFNPIGDIYKTEVFALMKLRCKAASGRDQRFNDMFYKAFGRLPVSMTEHGVLALEEIAARPPSAELRPDQKDSDSLPDYPVLDDVLKAMIDNKQSWGNERIAWETGHPLAIVEFVRRKLRMSEFKRDQSCPKPKIHMKSFTKRDWRYPLVNKFMG